MRKTLAGALFVIVAFVAVNLASAAFLDDVYSQQKRIDQGVISGRLTRAEAAILQDNLNWIKTRYTRLRAEGRLTAAEQETLNEMLTQNSRMIYDKKHNIIRPIFDVTIEARISRQQRRIDQGIASRQLTRTEAGVLQDNLNWIKVRYARLRTDGRLTQRERENLDRMLDQNSRMIADKKRNVIRRVY